MSVRRVAWLASVAVVASACGVGDLGPEGDAGRDATVPRADVSVVPPADATMIDPPRGDAATRDGCVPDCGGAHCGSDGCGGSCGTCATGTVCDLGTCVPDLPICGCYD